MSAFGNHYGPAETTIISTCLSLSSPIKDQNTSIPIGRPLPNYQCLILDEFPSNLSMIGQEGELFIGGVGVFAGYLGRDDLTAKALIRNRQ